MADAGNPPPASTSFVIRPLVCSDLPAVAEIERQSYPAALRETEAAFLSKMAVFRAGAIGCLVDGELRGYAFALPWSAARLIGVGEVLERLPDEPDVMYLHDMVVAPAHRRQGVASALLDEIVRLAGHLGLPRLVLVSVQESEPFWQRMGFHGVERFEYVPGVPALRMELILPAR